MARPREFRDRELMTFKIDREAIDFAREAEFETYNPPDFNGFSDLAVSYPGNQRSIISDPILLRVYIDALTDLHLLVEEYRFQALLALTLLRDYSIKQKRGDIPEPSQGADPNIDGMALPAEVAIVMRKYAVAPPSPAELFTQPHQQITAGRHLSRWFAAQMIDSALYRGIAACDRLAILLRCAAGLPIETTKRGDRRQPSFGRRSLSDLETKLGQRAGWQELCALTDHPLFDFIKQERNGFTHDRRRPSELHGERSTVYGSQGETPEEIVPAMDASTHYSFAPAFYNEVLCPAVRLSGAVITSD